MSDIILKTEKFVNEVLTQQLSSDFLYHNLQHTQRVVKSTKELLNFYKLEKTQDQVLILAAWLHDTGYTQGTENHEEKSGLIARKFLEEQGYDADLTEKVVQCIMATKYPYAPEDLPEKIMRDADASHLSQKNYIEISEMLRQELSLLGTASYSIKQWRKENIKLFQTKHHFYTDYAKENWQSGKNSNLKKLIKNQKSDKELEKKEALKAKYKIETPERGIQTMFRVTMNNHLKLSDIADTKANILLSVNAIIISLMLSNLIPKLDNPSNNFLIYPTVIFIVFSVISMILSILATRPNVTSGEFTKEDVKNKKVNLLFFGNFHKMKLEDYEWAIQELLKDKDYVYASLTKDLYFLGKVLDKKYKILRLTYSIFMTGMILSVIAFGISFHYLV